MEEPIWGKCKIHQLITKPFSKTSITYKTLPPFLWGLKLLTSFIASLGFLRILYIYKMKRNQNFELDIIFSYFNFSRFENTKTSSGSNFPHLGYSVTYLQRLTVRSINLQAEFSPLSLEIVELFFLRFFVSSQYCLFRKCSVYPTSYSHISQQHKFFYHSVAKENVVF